MPRQAPDNHRENSQKGLFSLSLCDKVILEDAIMKLQKAAAARKATGQPFFLASGFRKPHTPWRFPAPFLQYYNKDQSVDVAKHGVLDRCEKRLF